jgi:hypothetical protein
LTPTTAGPILEINDRGGLANATRQNQEGRKANAGQEFHGVAPLARKPETGWTREIVRAIAVGCVTEGPDGPLRIKSRWSPCHGFISI